MSKHISEESKGPRKGHAAGDTSIEQQASQLASDIKYKARQKMKGTSGSNLSPGQVQALYRSLLNSSPAPSGVKAIVKKKLFGEEIDRGEKLVAETLENKTSIVFGRVFVEGGGQKVEVEEIEEAVGQKFVIRVTDKATGNTTYRKADRAKIAELRANKNISSVEITGRKKADDAYGEKHEKKYGPAKGKNTVGDKDGDGTKEPDRHEYAGVKDRAIKKAMAKEETEIDEAFPKVPIAKSIQRELGHQDKLYQNKDGSRTTVRVKIDKEGNKRGVIGSKTVKGKMDEEYIDEGLRSAVKRLLGKKDAPAEKKPESRGEQLRKKYNVGPERSDTSAKKQILDRTRAKAERDKKEYGGSRYTKSVSDKSKAAHDRYLRAGYSKYGVGDARGKGNKARRRAEALKKEDFNWLVDTLISEGYNLSSYTVEEFYDFCEEVIYEKEESGEKKLDVMKGKNTIKVNPTIGESIRAELDALKAQRLQEQELEKEKQGPSPEEKMQLANKDKMLKKKIMMQKQTLQMQRQGRLPLNYSEEAGAVRYCPKCDKDETREECKYGGEYWDENSKPAKAEDPREEPTKATLFKNKLRARGIQVAGLSLSPRNMKTYDDLGEEASDRARDEHQMRGGMAARKDYDRPPAKKLSNKELGIKPGKTWVQKQMEKK